MTLPLLSVTPPEWGRDVLSESIALLADHAYLEKKAATNALDLLARWPGEWVPGWVDAMSAIARDEAAHLAQVARILKRRGARLPRAHKNQYANDLRALVRKGREQEIVDLLLVSALIEARSCERFGVLAEVAEDPELRSFYKALYTSELGHFQIFLRLAEKIASIEIRWNELLVAEAQILAAQPVGPRMHSGSATISGVKTASSNIERNLMALDTSEIRSTLNNLIETLKDGEEGFRTSAEKLQDSSLRSEFQTWAGQRGRFASELQNCVNGIGGEAATSGSATGAIHRGWIGLKSALTGNDDHAIVAEAERGEDVAVGAFRDAMTKDFPNDIRTVIERQYRDIQTAHNQVRSLRDGMKTTAGSTRAY